MDNIELLKPREVDLLFRYPAGRSTRLAKAGLIPYILLPDGQFRFNEEEIIQILQSNQTEGSVTNANTNTTN